MAARSRRSPPEPRLLEVLRLGPHPGPGMESQANASCVLQSTAQPAAPNEAASAEAGAPAARRARVAQPGLGHGFHARRALRRKTLSYVQSARRSQSRESCDRSGDIHPGSPCDSDARSGDRNVRAATALRCDNGPGFISQHLQDWAEENEIDVLYIQPGKPAQNAFIERFNRTYRQEVLDAYVFETIRDVEEITEAWRIDYNEKRPHDALGRIPPVSFMKRPSNPGLSSFEMCA